MGHLLKSEMATLKSKAWLRSSNPIPMNACFPAPRAVRTPIRIPTQLHLNSLHAPPPPRPHHSPARGRPARISSGSTPTAPLALTLVPVRFPPVHCHLWHDQWANRRHNPLAQTPSPCATTVIITRLQEDFQHEHRPSRSLANKTLGIGLRVQGGGARMIGGMDPWCFGLFLSGSGSTCGERCLGIGKGRGAAGWTTPTPVQKRTLTLTIDVEQD